MKDPRKESSKSQKEGAGEKRSPEAIIFHHCDFIDFDLVK